MEFKKTNAEVGDAMRSIRILVEKSSGVANVHLISYARGYMVAATQTWLYETMELHKRSGLPYENVTLCEARPGPLGKGPVAARKRITHFIDDSGENLQAVYRDPAGNAQDLIDANQGQLFLFARSGLRRNSEKSRAHFGEKVPTCMVRVNSWSELLASLSLN